MEGATPTSAAAGLLKRLLWAMFFFYSCFEVKADIFSHLPRDSCYNKPPDQKCDVGWADVYPELSLSATNSTVADTYLFLFTRNNRDEPEFLHRCGARLPPGTWFDETKRTKIFLHGYGSSMTNRIFLEMKELVLDREDCNLILVDYAWGNKLDYSLAVANAKGPVSGQVAQLIENIHHDTGAAINSFHLIGHSLGAQTAGMVGSKVVKTIRQKIGRITGLDPAGPLFSPDQTAVDDRLDRNDAMLVDIIHTGSGDCLPHLGTRYNVGHADFYVNGGTFQQTCIYGALEGLMKNDMGNFVTNVVPNFCFHCFSMEIFKISIDSDGCQFVGVKCDHGDEQCKSGKGQRDCGSAGSGRCALMGYHFDKTPMVETIVKNAPNVYYVDTTDRCPYCDNSKINLNGFRNA